MDGPKTQTTRLQDILLRFSNGLWEHGHGIVIENLDNPGWSIRVALSGSPFEQMDVRDRFEDRSEHDWIHIRSAQRDHGRFLELNCGPANLVEALDAMFQLIDIINLPNEEKS